MKRVPDTWPHINPKAYYPIGEAAELVAVSRGTLRKDALVLKVVKYITNAKTGRLKFLGRDLLHYRDFVR